MFHWLERYSNLIQAMVLIPSAIWAVVTLYEARNEARHAHTVDVLLQIQDEGFKMSYRRALTWVLEDTSSTNSWPSTPELAADVQRVLDSYEMVILFTSHDLLDKEIVNITIEKQACQLYNRLGALLEKHDAFHWWPQLRQFCQRR